MASSSKASFDVKRETVITVVDLKKMYDDKTPIIILWLGFTNLNRDCNILCHVTNIVMQSKDDTDMRLLQATLFSNGIDYI